MAVLDAAGIERVVVISLSLGAQRALIMADRHPDRVAGGVFICPFVPLGGPPSGRPVYSFDEELDTDAGWAKENRHYWLRDWPGFVEFFFSQMFNEPHSTKQIEDCVGWGLETDAETMLRGIDAAYLTSEETRALCTRFPGCRRSSCRGTRT